MNIMINPYRFDKEAYTKEANKLECPYCKGPLAIVPATPVEEPTEETEEEVVEDDVFTKILKSVSVTDGELVIKVSQPDDVEQLADVYHYAATLAQAISDTTDTPFRVHVVIED